MNEGFPKCNEGYLNEGKGNVANVTTREALERALQVHQSIEETNRFLRCSFIGLAAYLLTNAGGSYFKQFCMLSYQGDDDGYTQLIRFSDGEQYQEIKEDLDNLINPWSGVLV